MDYYSVESDILDSLEFLIPPVKKTLRKHSKDRNYIPDFSRQPDIHFIRKLCSTKHSKENSTEATDGASSTSVIIKKIPKRKFIKHKLYKDDTKIPLIRVTVIPKLAETQTSRVLNKRKQIVKRVQSTISNQESSIHSKNIYLVVTGQTADKIYEIKTTESEKFSSNQSSSHLKYEDIPLKKLSDYKQIIDSLNMEKKRKKDRKKMTNIPPRNESRASLVNEIFGGAGLTVQECICSNTRPKSTFNSAKRRKSRVRIIGQLGLRSDDKYVINYAATVNDKPVVANFTHIEKNLVPPETDDTKHSQVDSTVCTSACCTSNIVYDGKKYLRTQRDSNIQANLLEPTSHREFSKSYGIRQESQGTQVNLDKSFSMDKIRKKLYRDQTIQCYCNCSNVTDARSSTTGAVTKSSTIKDIKTPLVIISVYPKQDATENVSSHTLMNQRQILSKRTNDTNGQPQFSKKNNVNRNSSVSRSPSPTNRSNNKSHLSRNFETRFLQTNVKKKNIPHQVPITNQNKSSSPTELSSFTSKSKTRGEFFKKFPVTFGSRDSKETNMRSSKKKNLVDNYTIPPVVIKRDVANSPVSQKKNSSIVKVNIDTDRDRHDVMWHHRNMAASARVSRRPKDQDSQKFSDDDYGSMENYLMLTEDEKSTEGSVSQTLCYSTYPSPLLNTGLPHTLPQCTVVSHRNSSAFEEADNTYTTCFEDSCNSTYDCTNLPLVHLSCPMVVATMCSSNCQYHSKQSTNGTAICDTSQHSKTDGVGNSDSIEDEQRGCTKITQTSRSCEEFYGSQSNTNFFAPIKHFHGDSCEITDPLERDKEIRELLGIQQCRRSLSRTITQDYLSGIFSRDARCKKRDRKSPKRSLESSKSEDCKCCSVDKKLTKNRQCRLVTTKTTTTQYDLKMPPTPSTETPPPPPETCEKQQLILNRNIQVYLQIEQFTKQKPIMLTRKQYNKLKKTIQSTVKLKIPKEDKCKKNTFKTYSMLSSGQSKKSSKKESSIIRNQGMQTYKDAKRSRKLMTKRSSGRVAKKVYYLKETKPQTQCVCQEVQTVCSSRNIDKKFICNAYVSYDRQNVSEHMPRHAMSSLEIRYANVAYKRVTFSSTNVGHAVESNQSEGRQNYIQYLLKRQNKRATTNLGTSAYSLYSEPSGSNQSLKYLLTPRDSKQKRPFLRRLMSCLVMHSARASDVKIPCESKVSDVNSSIDSYYISTSLGAIEVTSSMYDTSASFYTTHTIIPMNKIKRGFLSSVRGFLTSRRS